MTMLFTNHAWPVRKETVRRMNGSNERGGIHVMHSLLFPQAVSWKIKKCISQAVVKSNMMRL